MVGGLVDNVISELVLGANASDQVALTVDLRVFRNPTNAPISTASLVANGTVAVNVAGSRLSLGQFPLVHYSGSIGGGGFAAFTLGTMPPGVTAELVNNIAGSSVDLKITSYVGSLVWTGEVGGAPAKAWDLGITADWADAASGASTVYHETKGSGPLVLFDDSASNAVVDVTVAVDPFSVTIDNTNLEYTIGGTGQISGSGPLMMQGAGLVVLTSSNTYSGDTTIASGTIQLGANGAIPGGSGKGNVTVNGTLDLAGFSDTINGLNGTGVVDCSAGSGTLSVGSNDQTSAFSGVITNSGGTLSLTKIGAGTLALSGSNTYAGSTRVLGAHSRAPPSDNRLARSYSPTGRPYR